MRECRLLSVVSSVSHPRPLDLVRECTSGGEGLYCSETLLLYRYYCPPFDMEVVGDLIWRLVGGNSEGQAGSEASSLQAARREDLLSPASSLHPLPLSSSLHSSLMLVGMLSRSGGSLECSDGGGASLVLLAFFSFV